MKWSFKIARVAGIDVLVHWTFGILVAWIFFAQVVASQNVQTALVGVGFLLAIFACVVLHEFGHALMARRFGVGTRDITLLPIGGVARLERMPEEPRQELWIALAGPAVNVAIALGLLLAMFLRGHWPDLLQLDLISGDFLTRLLLINVTLVVFNLLPAFPMDGGRVLRALLATRIDYVQATQISASVGQVMAILFGIVGLFVSPLLLFVALFVYLGAQGEAHMVQLRSLLRGVPVSEAMQTRFRALKVDDDLGVAIQELLAADQQDFPVVEEGRVVGLLLRSMLLKALGEGKRDVRVGDVMVSSCTVALENEMLEDTFRRMREQGCPMVPVVRGSSLVGVVTLENVGEWMMVHSALRKPQARGEIADIFGVR